jgi:hypothetical protein
MTNTTPLSNEEKVLVQRHLREGEEVVAVIRDVKYELEEERTLVNALLEKGKIPIILMTAINGKAARIIFLNKSYDGLMFRLSNSNVISSFLPDSIVLSPELIYKVITEFISKSEESFEKNISKETRNEFSRGLRKLMTRQLIEELKHPNASNLDLWFEIKSVSVDKKLLGNEYVSMILISESAERKAKMNITSLEQIKESMGSATWGVPRGVHYRESKLFGLRPLRLNLFLMGLTDYFYAFVKQAMLS